MQNDLAILILAAGSSSRLGQPKQLVMYHDETLLRRSANQALELSPNVFVVLGHEYKACSTALEGLHVNVLYHENYAKGMGRSIAFGVSHTTSFEHTLIMLCDQPLIPKSHYDALIATAGSRISASQYLDGDRLGVPAIFPHAYYEALMQLNGDKGAQRLLKNELCDSIYLANEWSIDIDTAEDIKKYL